MLQDVPLSVLNSLILPHMEKEDQMSCQNTADSEGLDVIESEFSKYIFCLLLCLNLENIFHRATCSV